MRNTLIRILLVLLVWAIPRPAHAQLTAWPDGSTELLFWDESNDTGDPTRFAQGWLEVRDYGHGHRGWVWFTADVVTQTVETRWPYGELQMANWSQWGVKGPDELYFDGIDCWDQPALGVHFGDTVQSAVRNALRGAIGGAIGGLGRDRLGPTLLGGVVGAIYGPIFWHTARYAYSCFYWR